MITLKEHNIKPYEELCRMLETQDKVAYVSATGTGKSYVIGKYIEEHDLIKKTIILVPSLPIKRGWKKLLPQVRVYTYQAMLSDKAKIKDCDLLICDEMHHLGAEEWGNACQSIFTGFNGKIIGTTATPVRFLDNQRNIADEFFEGNQVNGVDLPEAISQGVLPSFEYITALYDLPKRLKNRRNVTPYTENLYARLDLMSSKYSFQQILKKHMHGNQDIRVAVFVNHIAEIDTIKTLCETVYPVANHFVAHSKMKRNDTETAIRQFESTSGMCFLYTINILNEGVHIDGVDSVIMFRKTQSPIVYLQQLGRALSSNNTEKRIKVFDFVANHCNLDTYMKTGNSTIRWIADSISEPDKQIVIADYALEELELLDRLKKAIGQPWTEKEDKIILDLYGGRGKIDNIITLLPWRTRKAIKLRAHKLGCTQNKQIDYDNGLEDDIRRLYPEDDGTERLLEMYPEISRMTLMSIASRLGIHKKKNFPNWTKEEDQILVDHPEATKEELIALFPHRTYRAICRRRYTIGLTQRRAYVWPDNTEEILLANRHLTTPELQKQFFPGISYGAIFDKRKNVGASIINYVKWTPDKIQRLLDLYGAGGWEKVKDAEEFSSMDKAEIIGKAAKFRYKLKKAAEREAHNA